MSNTMNGERSGMKRVTIRYEQPNPLFNKWLTDLYNESVNKGSCKQYTCKKALQALQKYPLPLPSGKDCLILKNFGPKLSQFLDLKLEKHKRETHRDGSDNQVPKPVQIQSLQNSTALQSSQIQDIQIPSSQKRKQSGGSPETNKENKEAKSKRKSGVYVPAFRSGPYAFLITLFSHEGHSNFPGYLTKAELLEEAQLLCDFSLTTPIPGSRYTVWSSMKSVVNKGLISRTGNPARFSLTPEGRELAVKLLRANTSNQAATCGDKVPDDVFQMSQPIASKPISPPSNGPIMASQSVRSVPQKRTQTKKTTTRNDSPPSCSQGTSKDSYVPFSMEPGTFDVILIVDTSETTGNNTCNKTKAVLEEHRVNFEVRRLKVGDFLWVARDKNTQRELVLPYIVERKRMDDLGSSIKDGRYHEQKFRLKKSGIKNLVYLVESYGNNERLGLPLATVQQAAVNTKVVGGFQVKYTNDHAHSMMYLAAMTLTLRTIYKDKTLVSSRKSELADKCLGPEADVGFLLTYEELNKLSGKVRNFKVREMLIRQLLQLHGLSVQKALAIATLYSTPKALMNAFETGGEDLLTNVRFGTNNRKLGPVISKALHRLYTARSLS